MPVADIAQWGATVIMAVIGSAAFWSYWKDRKKSKAEGTVASATVEIQVEAHRVANLEQRFAFAQSAWDEERGSLLRRIEHLEELLDTERKERSEDEKASHEKIRTLEARVFGMQRELNEVTVELATLRRMREKKPDQP
jgi:chromosome segregation ATPase